MLLSICVPTRNRPVAVERLLRTLVDLPSDVLEVEILVGDNSTNNDTRRVCQQFPSVDYLHNADDLGAYGNFNSLIARAHGDWVHLIADDDEIEPDYLKGIRDAVLDPDAVLVTGRVGFVGTDAAAVEAAHYARLTRMGVDFPMRVQGDAVINAALIHGCPFEFSHTLMRRRTLIAVGGFDARFRLQGDYELWLRMLGQGAARFVDAELGNFRVYEGNMLGDKESARQFRVERTIIRLTELSRHLALLQPAVRKALLREIRAELPRVLTFARVGIGGPMSTGMLELALLRAESSLRTAGHGTTLRLPGHGLVAETPRPLLRLAYVAIDSALSRRRVGRSAGDIGERIVSLPLTHGD